jgi:hypothetical protein
MPTFLTRRQAFFSSMRILVAVSSMNAFPNLAFALPQANGGGKSAQLPSASNMKTIGLIGGTSWAVDFILGSRGLAHVRPDE